MKLTRKVTVAVNNDGVLDVTLEVNDVCVYCGQYSMDALTEHGITPDIIMTHFDELHPHLVWKVPLQDSTEKS